MRLVNWRYGVEIMKKISSFEYALFEALDRHDLIEGCEPRTPQEEKNAANEKLRDQLKTFRNATTNEPLFPEPQDS
jgi:hypothetical protein